MLSSQLGQLLLDHQSNFMGLHKAIVILLQTVDKYASAHARLKAENFLQETDILII